MGAAALLGEDLGPVEEAVVTVARSGRISAAGDRSDVEVAAGADIFDGSGLLLLPGFIDAHVHIGLADPAAVVAGGVTTARDLAWPPDEIWPLVEASAGAGFRGPRLLAAGQMLTVPGGYPTRSTWAPPGTGRTVADRADAEKAVGEQADPGACVIKVGLNAEAGPTLSTDLLAAVVAAAHARGLRVTGHVTGMGELEKAVNAGVDELAHMLMSEEEIPPRLIDELMGRGIVIVPTLSCRFGSDQDVAIDNLRRFVSAGGRVVYGTDLGNEGPRPGIDSREIDAMVRAGMDTRAIVTAATVGAADWLDLRDRGVLEPGKIADIVAVDRAALDDAHALTSVAAVWRAGVRF